MAPSRDLRSCLNMIIGTCSQSRPSFREVLLQNHPLLPPNLPQHQPKPGITPGHRVSIPTCIILVVCHAVWPGPYKSSHLSSLQLIIILSFNAPLGVDSKFLPFFLSTDQLSHHLGGKTGLQFPIVLLRRPNSRRVWSKAEEHVRDAGGSESIQSLGMGLPFGLEI
jgi:hypothetical protein